MRLPAPILEHPIESAIAGLLLAALLFVSAGPEPQSAGMTGATVAHPPQSVSEKM